MKATAAMSIAALAAALAGSPLLPMGVDGSASEPGDANTAFKVRSGSTGIDAASIQAIAASVDGSADVYEG